MKNSINHRIWSSFISSYPHPKYRFSIHFCVHPQKNCLNNSSYWVNKKSSILNTHLSGFSNSHRPSLCIFHAEIPFWSIAIKSITTFTKICNSSFISLKYSALSWTYEGNRTQFYVRRSDWRGNLMHLFLYWLYSNRIRWTKGGILVKWKERYFLTTVHPIGWKTLCHTLKFYHKTTILKNSTQSFPQYNIYYFHSTRDNNNEILLRCLHPHGRRRSGRQQYVIPLPIIWISCLPLLALIPASTIDCGASESSCSNSSKNSCMHSWFSLISPDKTASVFGGFMGSTPTSFTSISSNFSGNDCMSGNLVYETYASMSLTQSSEADASMFTWLSLMG